MKVKIKKLSEKAVIPSYAKNGDAGMDFTATSRTVDEDGNTVYGTSLALEIPDGYVGLLFPRSSNSKKELILANSVGVIDSGYRGEVTFKFKPTLRTFSIWSLIKSVFIKAPNIDLTIFRYKQYQIGDRVGQLIILPYPKIEFEEADELSETERGAGGYGSTGE